MILINGIPTKGEKVAPKMIQLYPLPVSLSNAVRPPRPDLDCQIRGRLELNADDEDGKADRSVAHEQQILDLVAAGFTAERPAYSAFATER